MDMYERVYGSLLGAAVGDAMGAVTESKTPDMIVARFGGYVEELLPGVEDTFVSGCEAGAVTDDFSLAYFTAQSLSRCGGKVTPQVAREALLTWAAYPEFFRFAGPTTKASVVAIQEETQTLSELHFLACENAKATNGSAMKISPVGLINPGELDKAIQDAVTICLPTHDNDASLAGAAAVAAAVAKAVVGGSCEEVLQAGLYGAEKGYVLGRQFGKRTSVPSITKRILLAIEIAGQGMGWEETMLELGDVVGSGIAVAEAVPCVFGILAYTGDDVMQAIKMGVNIGNDTDTVATMVGAIAGAMAGAGKIPERYGEMIDRVNHFGLKALARKILEEYYQ